MINTDAHKLQLQSTPLSWLVKLLVDSGLSMFKHSCKYVLNIFLIITIHVFKENLHEEVMDYTVVNKVYTTATLSSLTQFSPYLQL